MKFELSNKKSEYPEVMVFPIVQDGNQSAQIEKIAKRLRFSPEIIKNDFKAALKECIPLYLKGNCKKIFFLGLGENPGFGEFVMAARSFIHNQKGKMPAVIGIDFNFVSGKTNPTTIEAFLNGAVLGKYNINLYKTETKEASEFSNGQASIRVFSTINIDKFEQIAKKAQVIGETQLRIFDLVNAAANKKTPQVLAKWAEESAKSFGYHTNIFLGRENLEKLGTHALLAVNKGSDEPPALIVMEYKPKVAGNYPKIALVGKGVTFDTGGISIKPSTGMHNMKSDMGGAAAVLGTMEAAARLGLPVHLVGIVPSTENCVDGAGTKPSDVFSSYSGKTIEMIDTDAEGRLILADGLSYAVKNYQPDTLIDLATLTGSVIATLGYTAAGLFTNNDQLADKLYKVGKNCGERLWRLPLWDNYKDDLNSDVADIKNLSGKPVAGAITAAKFLETFTEKHLCWAHLDIAGVAFSDSEFATMKSGTAFGVRLLIDYLGSIEN
ncbi:MAG: leucyl aminopeptidase family protein [Saprospiraceae bacterium]